jgi:hypothetical protein
MEYLFDSEGNHITNFLNEQLHAPAGQHVGHFIKTQGIFVDLSGNYLGEIVQGDRLMYNNSSPHKNTNHGSYEDCGNARNYGDPGNYGNKGVLPGYEDIETPWL